jgi:hypothetical protein
MTVTLKKKLTDKPVIQKNLEPMDDPTEPLKANVKTAKKQWSKSILFKPTIKTFKLNASDAHWVNAALGTVRQVSGAKTDSVALAIICHNYLGAGMRWKKALTYASKHCGDRGLFVKQVLEHIKKLCPELQITCKNT